MLTMTFTDGARHVTWRGADFSPRPENATPSTLEWSFGSQGPDLVVTFRLEDGGQLLSQGTVAIPRRSDWRWG